MLFQVWLEGNQNRSLLVSIKFRWKETTVEAHHCWNQSLAKVQVATVLCLLKIDGLCLLNVVPTKPPGINYVYIIPIHYDIRMSFVSTASRDGVMQWTPWSFFTPSCGQEIIEEASLLQKVPHLTVLLCVPIFVFACRPILPWNINLRLWSCVWAEERRKRGVRANSSETQAPWDYSASQGKNGRPHMCCVWLGAQSYSHCSIDHTSPWVA